MLCLLSSPASACDPQAASGGPRRTIVLFDYSGAEQGEAKNQYSLFKGALRDKMTVWFEELSDLRRGAPFLDDLRLHPQGGISLPDSLAGPGDVEEYWRRNQALEILRGGILPSDGGFSVQTRIYLGDLSGRLGSTSVSVRLPIASSEFGNASDSHSLVTYYALAMEAKRLKCHSGVVVGLLSKASEIAADLVRRNMGDPEIDRMRHAIDTELRAATQGGTP
jgi:hypothetical protein